ncbi:MAG: CHAT domain-containing protein [Spirochaetes bacterium]|nr:CHAT domain-containing protein [Spirochaetota bacterium]
MDDRGILDRRILGRWRKLAKRDEKRAFYFDHILPRITELLKMQIGTKVADGSIPRYTTLALVVGHDANPALIIANAIIPQRLFAGYTSRNEAQLRKRFLPNLDPSIPRDGIRLIELDNMGHEENYRKLLSVLGSIEDPSSTLCDVTGGKKILSAQMGIAAHERGMDISYIDAEGHEEHSAVPEPGRESLFIHSASNRRVTEIPLLEENRLVINFVSRSNIILYNLNIGNEFHRYEKANLSESGIEEVRRGMAVEYMKIERNIMDGKPCSPELGAIASIARSMLMEVTMDARLKDAARHGIRISVDPTLSGIPWETVLHVLHGIHFPIRRSFNRDFDSYAAAIPDEKHGVLIVIGSGEGIPGFDENEAQLKQFVVAGKLRGEFIRAENKGHLQMELGRRRYNAIVYLGHSVFDSTPGGTGWVCRNGEIFCCDSLAALAHTPPDLVISSSCRSAAAEPFSGHSFAYHAVKAGVRSFIGTNWQLEYEKSYLFLTRMLDSLVVKGHTPFLSFTKALEALAKRYGQDDISQHNYVYYGE